MAISSERVMTALVNARLHPGQDTYETAAKALAADLLVKADEARIPNQMMADVLFATIETLTQHTEGAGDAG